MRRDLLRHVTPLGTGICTKNNNKIIDQMSEKKKYWVRRKWNCWEEKKTIQTEPL
jgi:hypothetical protein